MLHVGLPTNFKAAAFEDPAHNDLLNRLAEDIAAVTLDGNDVPVKLRVYDLALRAACQVVDAADRQTIAAF